MFKFHPISLSVLAIVAVEGLDGWANQTNRPEMPEISGFEVRALSVPGKDSCGIPVAARLQPHAIHREM